MPDTFTTNYNWLKPSVGGDSTTWGGDLNTDLDGIDSTVHAVSLVANAALPAASFTPAAILADILTVDGSGSGLDADKLDGQDSPFYRNASNLNAGVVPLAQTNANIYRGSQGFGSANITVSSSAPSGGAAGDLWLQI